MEDMERFKKIQNDQLINLCEYLLKFLSEPGTYEAYHTQEWQELENATNELLKRAGIRMDKNLDACELSDFVYLIEKAKLTLKQKQ